MHRLLVYIQILHLLIQHALSAGKMEPFNTAYDLFLSHRGPDKKDFCAFLKEALHRAGVHAFVDESDLKVGDPDAAWTTMQAALRGARYVMPVISEGYCDSRWCLDELVLMMQSPAKVMPVFWDVGPDKDALAAMLSRCVRVHACVHTHAGRLADAASEMGTTWALRLPLSAGVP